VEKQEERIVPNKIYVVAGERNMKLAQIEGGLWANVGQTTRDVSDRLRDDDYKRKAAGGKWQVLLNQDVGESLSDHQVHPFLKQHPEVSWDRESDNTEEFFFKGDPGDGSVARQIVSEILRRICVPLLQQENSKLHEEADRRRGPEPGDLVRIQPEGYLGIAWGDLGLLLREVGADAGEVLIGGQKRWVELKFLKPVRPV